MSKSFFHKIKEYLYISDENRKIVRDYIDYYFKDQDDEYIFDFLYTINDEQIVKRMKPHSLKDSINYLVDFSLDLEEDQYRDNTDVIETIDTKTEILITIEHFYQRLHSEGITLDYPTLFSIYNEYFKDNSYEYKV